MNGFKSYTGSKNKWCNFAFSTEDAPARLQKLSAAAKLPKERAVLSFISLVKGDAGRAEGDAKELLLRINSDPFRLPKNRSGFYCCSRLGLTLAASENLDALASGDLISVELTKNPDQLPEDFKSGAKIIHL